MAKPRTITEQLRAAVKASGRSLCSICEEAGTAPIGLSRLMRGQRTVTLETVDKLAPVLGLELSYADGDKA